MIGIVRFGMWHIGGTVWCVWGTVWWVVSTFFDLASAAGLWSGLAGRGFSTMSGFPVFASVFAGDVARLFIVFNIALNELWDDS